MGVDGDRGAVVDAGLRVRGVDGLYVADGSAVPVVPSRGPHATVIALAERFVLIATTDSGPLRA
ncbi:GMC oxidoreductase [Tsukamurella soli]